MGKKAQEILEIAAGIHNVRHDAAIATREARIAELEAQVYVLERSNRWYQSATFEAEARCEVFKAALETADRLPLAMRHLAGLKV